MAHIFRTLTVHSYHLKRRTAGKYSSFSTWSNVLSAVSTESGHNRIKNSLKEFKNIQRGTEVRQHSEFNNVRLGLMLLKNDFREPSIFNIFCKLLEAYKKSISTPNFEEDLNTFSCSDDFKNFCSILERKLPNFSIRSLLMLYDLEYFNVSPSSPLMKKLFTLVLNKFESAGFCEKLYIYGKTSSKPFKHNDKQKIIDLCESYFKKSFEYDLQYEKYSNELLSLFDIDGLPKHIKLFIADKLIDEVKSHNITKRNAVQVFLKLVEAKDDLLPRDKLLQFISIILETNLSQVLLENFSLIYFKLVKKDTSCYCPEIVEIITKRAIRNGHHSKHVHIGEELCLIGHLSREFLNVTTDKLMSTPVSSFTPKLLMGSASFLSRASFHEIFPDSTVANIKNVLETDDAFKLVSKLQNISLWCLYLMHMGCDTRNLLSIIFRGVNNQIYEGRDSKILLLHHLAKSCFPGEYEPLSSNAVDYLVEEEFKKTHLLDSNYNINECFESGDFVLRNCVTSDKHCLHFVTVFQSDRKPVNLSKYSKMSKSVLFNVDVIEKPPGSKMIAFMLYPDQQPIKYLNFPALSGYAKIYLKSFENLNGNVVLLPRMFYSLTLEDKKKFLNSQISQLFEKSEF